MIGKNRGMGGREEEKTKRVKTENSLVVTSKGESAGVIGAAREKQNGWGTPRAKKDREQRNGSMLEQGQQTKVWRKENLKKVLSSLGGEHYQKVKKQTGGADGVVRELTREPTP